MRMRDLIASWTCNIGSPNDGLPLLRVGLRWELRSAAPSIIALVPTGARDLCANACASLSS